MRALYHMLISQKTVFVLYIALTALFGIGSVMLPNNLAFFSGIDDEQLFVWLGRAGEFGITWWIYAAIGVLGLMALSLVVCTSDMLIKRSTWQNPLLRLSPHILHIGTVLVMFGYLLTSAYGFKSDYLIAKGETRDISGGVSVGVSDVVTVADETGYLSAWEAALSVNIGGVEKTETLKPLVPVSAGVFELFFKSISLDEKPSVLIRAVKDPGAGWVLAGGALVLLGCMGIAYSRLRQD